MSEETPQTNELAVEDTQRKEAESRLALMSEEEICRLADLHFPYRSTNNTPSYRPHQRDTILKAINAIRSGKRFVLIDGPVGCGKSAINYTIGEVCGSSLYLTSQKQLQDQIVRERWPNVKMVKGKGAYSCNFLSSTHDVAKCDYKGDKYSMCNNTTFQPKDMVPSVFIENVKAMLKRHANDDRMLRMKTAFEIDDNVEAVIQKVMDFIDQTIPVESFNRSELIRRTFKAKMCCQCNPNLECPARSSRFIAKLFGTKVLNPDVLYVLQFTGATRFFSNAEVMIIDECHSIESFISRIFEAAIPVGMLHKMFGVPAHSLMSSVNTEFMVAYGKFVQTVITPVMALGKLLADMKDLCNTTCYMDIIASKFKTSWTYEALMLDMHDQKEIKDFSLLTIIAHSLAQDETAQHTDVMAKFPSFSKAVITKYSEYMNAIKGVPDSVALHSFDMFSWIMPGCVRYFKQARPDRVDGVRTEDVFYSRHIVALAEMLERMKRSIDTIIQVTNRVGDKEYPAFVALADKECHFRSSFDGMDGLERLAIKFFGAGCKDKFDHVSLTPVITASFLHRYFYSCAEHVVLSTGTWVHLDGMRAVYGISKANSEYIRIPTTFPKSNRPVFVISDRRKTNFSEKTEQKAFVYKTEEGTPKFCNELSEVLVSARKRIQDKTGINVNAIVHCHTFDIARRIAEHMQDVDQSYLIHIAPHDRDIVNVHTHHTTYPRQKDDLVQQFIEHPDSGLTLISASVSEGVDFKDGIARLQVLLKKPIPYLGDPYVNARFRGDPSIGLEKDPLFMDRVIFTETIQQYGRIMRGQDDWGITIVLDQAMAKSLWYILKPNGGTVMNMDYFLQGIKGGIKDGKVYFDDF